MKRYLLIVFLFINNIVCNVCDDYITIFVHGTVGIEVNLTPKIFFKLLRDTIHTTPHPKKIAEVREKLVTRGLHCVSPLGITKIEYPKCLKATDIFALLYDEVDRKVNGACNNHYYTFGWTGLLSYSERKRESQNLYNKIIELLKEHQDNTGKVPKIRLIGYSHGGDVSLGLSKVFNSYNIKIDELIVIGMPVSCNTKNYIKSPMFKRIYNVYSQGDYTQYLDLFSPGSLISGKAFPSLAPNITEIEIQVKAKRLNSGCCQVLPSAFRGTRNQSPGHVELWSFGWVRKYYRKNFVFYPLPFAVFLPYVINIGKNYPCEKITLDIRPDQELTFVKADSCYKTSFFSRDFVSTLKNITREKASDCFNLKF